MSSEEVKTFAAQCLCWDLEALRNHVFHRIWTCGVPVHLRYVMAIIRHAALAEEVQGQAALERWARRHVFAPVLHRAREANERITDAGLRVRTADGEPLPALTEVVPLGLSTHPASAATGMVSTSAEEWCVVRAASLGTETDAPAEGEGERGRALAEVLASRQPWEITDTTVREARAGAPVLTSSYWTGLEDAKALESYLGTTEKQSPRWRPGSRCRAQNRNGRGALDAVVIVDEDEDALLVVQSDKDVSVETIATPSSQTSTAHTRKSRRLEEVFSLSSSLPSPGQSSYTDQLSKKCKSAELVVVISSEDDEDTTT